MKAAFRLKMALCQKCVAIGNNKKNSEPGRPV